jgi:hypothetical protein
MCHKSPAKVLRNVRRITLFLEKKPKTLSVSLFPQVNISPFVKPLSLSPLVTTDVPPLQKNVHISKLAIHKVVCTDLPPIKKKHKLDLVKATSTSIPPRQVYHPCIINASRAFFGRHPQELASDEALRFQMYQKDKTLLGEPLEKEITYLPIGGLRTCVNCGELT